MSTKAEVSNVELESVGLVDVGASGEDFFLRKSNKNKETAIFLRSIAKVIGDEADAQEEVIMENVEKTTIEPVVEDVIEPAVEPVAEPIIEATPAVVEKKETNMSDFTEELSKLAKERETLAKSNEELSERLAKAEELITKERERNDRVEEQAAIAREVQLAKSSYAYIPVSQTEVGNFMYWVRKTDTEKAEWIESVLKATDAQLREASLYTEVGTSVAPDTSDPIAKAGEAVDVKAELLSADPKAAAAYLAKRRNTLRVGVQ